MICYIFRLDKYFSQTSQYYHLFDSLFAYHNIVKKDVLDSLEINRSTYRVEKTRTRVSHKNINLLLNYFDYKDVYFDEKLKYESLISRVYYCCYYNNVSAFDYFLDELNVFINDNNVLKPIFVLFKLFIYIHKNLKPSEYNRLLTDDLDYLHSFYTSKYFTEELEYIYLLVMYFYKRIDINVDKNIEKLKEFCFKEKKLSWIYYSIRAIKAYENDNDQEVIMYCSKLIDEYRNTNNMIKYFHVLNNISYAYNLEEEYDCSLNYTSNVIEYLYSSIEHKKWISFILNHYLFSNLMLKKYDDIMDFINIIIFDKKYISDISATICLIAMNETKRFNLYDEINSYCNLKSFSMFKVVKEFYDTKDESVLSKISSSPYPNRIRLFIKNDR